MISSLNPNNISPFGISNSAVIYKYNPHQMMPGDILETFVGREELLSQMIAHLRAQRGVSRPSHFFIYGSRGMGKTTLLLSLRYRLADHPDLRRDMDVVQFSEEERRVANLPSFAIRTLELLKEVRPELETDLKKAQGEPETAFDVLLGSGIRSPDRQVLLLLDNFDELVIAAVSEKGRRFKTKEIQPLEQMARLLSSPHFLLVATALQPPQKRKDFPGELIKYFDPIVSLTPLTDATEFLRKRAERDRREGFLKSLPAFSRRIEGLTRLAEGNPRLLVFLYHCLGDHPPIDLAEIVQRTVDDLTPMYQDVIDRLLNRGQAAVLEMLAARGGVGKAKDIAELTYQDKQTVRTALGNLCDLGLVIRHGSLELPGSGEGRKTRETVFRTYPPLFQIWYEMRHFQQSNSLFLVRFFSLLTERKAARRTLVELEGNGIESVQPVLSRVMEGVSLILDPEWSGLKEKHVTEVVNKNGTLRDALKGLDRTLSELDTDQIQLRTGLYVVRSEVRLLIGDIKGAETDLQLAELQEAADIDTRIKVLTALSAFFQTTGQYQRAVRVAEEAIELCTGPAAACAPVIQAGALMALARVYNSLSRYDTAQRLASQAYDQLRNITQTQLKARAMSLLGNIAHSLGDYKISIDRHEKSLATSKEIGDRRGEAASLGNLGLVYHSLGEYDRARDYHEKSLRLEQDLGDRRGEAASLGNLGLLYHSLGEYDRARDYHEKSLRLEQDLGDRRGEAASFNNLGTVYLSMGDPQKALSHFKGAYDIFLSLGERPHIQQCAAHAVESLFRLASASIQSGDPGGAVSFVDQAINYAGHSGHDRFLAHFTSLLVIPTLRKSEDLSSQLLSLVERFRGHKAFRDSKALLNLFEAFLRFYEAGRAPAALNRLGPVEIFLVKSILDRIERHRHVEAGQLFEAGKVLEEPIKI